MENAHSDVFNIMLQDLEDGRLADNKGSTVDFKNKLIIMTSNIESSIIEKGAHYIWPYFGPSGYADEDNNANKIQSLAIKELKQYSPQEFLNRLGKTVVVFR